MNMINKASIDNALSFLARENDGSNVMNVTWKNAIKLLEKWVKQMIIFRDINPTSNPEFITHLTQIIMFYKAVITTAKNDHVYKQWLARESYINKTLQSF